MQSAVKNVARNTVTILLIAAALPASTVGWVNGMFIPNDAAYQAAFGGGSTGATDTLFPGAMPPQMQPAEPAPNDPEPTAPAVSPLTLTEDGLLSFIFQNVLVGLDESESASLRAVLAPQYAAFAAYLQSRFAGATEIAPDAGNGTPAADPVPEPGPQTSDSSITMSMATVAASALLADPSPSAALPMLAGGGPTLATSSFSLLPGGVTTFDTTAVPETSSLLLAAGALAAAWLTRRPRRA